MLMITGSTLYTTHGEKIGDIVDVLGGVEADADPEWLTVKTGWFRQRLVPFASVRRRGRDFEIECDADHVTGAPRVPTHLLPSGDDRTTLELHYGRLLTHG